MTRLFQDLSRQRSAAKRCEDFADDKLYFYPPPKLADGDEVIADNSEPLIKLKALPNLIAGCTIRNVSRYAAVFNRGFGNEIRSSDLVSTRLAKTQFLKE